MKKAYLCVVYVCICFLPLSAFAAEPSFDELLSLIEGNKTEEIRGYLKRYPNAINLRNKYGFPILHRATMTDKHEAVLVLLEAGADFKSRDNMDRTPLHIAAGFSTLEMVEVVWKQGADPNVKTNKGLTPLDFAMSNFFNDQKIERDKILTFLKGRGSMMSEGEKQRQKVIKEYEAEIASRPDKGPKPEQSEWDGSVPIVKEYVMKRTGDSKAKFKEWSKVTALGDRWAVRAKFEALNSRGIAQEVNGWFYIRNGKVIGTKPAE